MLLEKIRQTVNDLVKTQAEDGYIGNYEPSARLQRWDIWGRKYTALALLSYYRLSGDASFLESASIRNVISVQQETSVFITKLTAIEIK